MDPLMLGVSLAGMLGSAVWQVVADNAGNRLLDHVKHAWLKKFLRNDDIQRVTREAYQTALTMIEKEYFKRDGAALSREDRKAVEAALKDLRARAEIFFPKDPDFAERLDARAPELLSPGPTALEIADQVLRQVGPVPPSFRGILEASFAEAFVFCFKELGLKGDEKVRSVIYYEMLSDLRVSARSTEEGLRKITDALGTLGSEEKFRRQFESAATEKLDRIDTAVRRLEEKLAPTATADARGVLHVYDAEGKELARHPISTNVLSIGRDPSNAIQLANGAVSGRHAEVAAQGIYFVIRDLGSTNGTFVGGAKVKSRPVGFGDRIKIGPFTLSIEEPKGADDVMYPPTLPISS